MNAYKIVSILSLICCLTVANAKADSLRIERVTTKVPFPRGLALKDGKLYVLCRGRVRGAGGVTAEIEDQAGTIYTVDPNITEPISSETVGDGVRTNGDVMARPTSPPFELWDRNANPPHRDRFTDRPYCTLRYHEGCRSFFICAFSGVDKAKTPQDPVAFSKNLTDAILRYDLRTKKWYEVERHNIQAGGIYPHHDPAHYPPPHGWLNGPDNCLALGNNFYAVSKDNTRLVRYDLGQVVKDPEAKAPPSEVVLGASIHLKGHGVQKLYGMSALAHHDGMLYVGYRTSSKIVRLKLDKNHVPVKEVSSELVAHFDPYDPMTGKSANITDMTFDGKGRLYVVTAKPAQVYRFKPDPEKPLDGRNGRAKPWADLAAATNNPSMKSENILYHDGWLYVTSGDGYSYQKGAEGTVYRVRVTD